MLEYGKYEELIGKEVYACSFEISNSKKGTILRHQEPCKGIICRSGYLQYISFVPYNDQGDLIESKAKRLDTCKLKFFDNYKECINYYNYLVQERIDAVQCQLNDLKRLLIEVNKDDG